MAIWEDEDAPPVGRLQRWRAVIRKQPSAMLLFVQLLAIVLIPWFEGHVGGFGRLAISLLSAVALTLAVVTVRSTPALTWLSIALMVPALGLEIWSAVSTQEYAWVPAAAHFALAVFYFYTAYGLISYMFEDAWVTKDEIFAVGACFTVLLFAFAYLFLGTQGILPGSFTAHGGVGQRSFMELIYFSGANLTSVGLSDVGPVLPQARAITTIEQVGGVLYVAMVISRLVALTVMRNRP